MDDEKTIVEEDFGSGEPLSAQGPNWQDQDDILRQLWEQNLPPSVIGGRLGRSVAAVMTRAARLGLPRRSAPGRKPGSRNERSPQEHKQKSRREAKKNLSALQSEERTANSQMAMRVCLMCLNKFQSQGRHNRICPSCKETAEYVTASRVPDITYGVEA